MSTPQLVGYDLVAGEDTMDVIGADGKTTKIKADRLYALHLPITSFATTVGGTLQNSPSKPFRPDRIVVESDVVEDGGLSFVRVGTITAGNITLTIGAGGVVHGTVYGATAIGTRLKGETVSPGVACSVAVTNAATVTQSISAAMFGLSNQ